ncbi:MAG TPA: hypothetical protein PL041_15640 [Melioribacteraceae bacterium]|nr:hypothetical protein [Melioribacteraceae bacterium]
MEKIQVKICMGTTCFILCNSELQEIEDEINPNLLPYIEIMGSSCLGYCKESNYHKIPCASIDGNVIENVNKATLLKSIEDAVKEKFGKELKNGK